MNHLKKITGFYICLFFMSGCATTLSYEQIMHKAEAVNAGDGIDKSEAVLIAQKFLIDNRLDSQNSVYNIGEILKEQDDSSWLVNFKGVLAQGVSQNRRFDFTKPIIIKIDATTGKAEVLE